MSRPSMPRRSITGAGRFDHSVRAGLRVDPNDADTPGGVLGCDSVLNAVYRGQLFWVWGNKGEAGLCDIDNGGVACSAIGIRAGERS